jgi:hypothetical protein
MRMFSVGKPTLFVSLESTPTPPTPPPARLRPVRRDALGVMAGRTAQRQPLVALRWPLPALWAWSLCWGLYLMWASMAMPTWLAGGAASALGLCLGMFGRTRVRSAVMAAGFPLSWLATLASDVLAGPTGVLPAWAWLLPLAMLMLLYPHRAWRDAPLFPTPSGALDVLSVKVRLPSPARVLDAGCGLGHGLQALHRAFPQARIEGIEWSWPLAWLARLRCRFAVVRRGDMWAQSWRGYDLVYLFQRPESMARAVAKASAEMAQGSWLASLEFEAGDWLPQAVMPCADGRQLWLYRLPLRPMPTGAKTLVTLGSPRQGFSSAAATDR